jgi:hypothetical protein
MCPTKGHAEDAARAPHRTRCPNAPHVPPTHPPTLTARGGTSYSVLQLFVLSEGGNTKSIFRGVAGGCTVVRALSMRVVGWAML